jgi:hypothetical protein
MSRKTKRFLPRLRRWRQKARWARRKLARVPRIVRIAGVVAILFAVVALTNIVYQVIHKPTELFATKRRSRGISESRRWSIGSAWWPSLSLLNNYLISCGKHPTAQSLTARRINKIHGACDCYVLQMAGPRPACRSDTSLASPFA